MGKAKILIYGSYGFTGDLMARLAKERGIEVALAGRNAERVQAQASALGFAGAAFDLSDQAALHAALRDVEVVIHCAGPFAHTYETMVEACLATDTHYLDITGETAVFDGMGQFDERAKAAGLMLLPGAGFDVVPSDCLANQLKAKLPRATHLELAFRSRGGGTSHGTALTIAENIHRGGMIRQDGELTRVPNAYKTRMIDFGDGQPTHCMTIPWGDVVTAYISSGIPNILVYTEAPEKAARALKVARVFMPLLGTAPAQSWMRKKIKAGPAGPDEERRKKAINELWGEARDAEGNSVQGRLRTPEGYTLTADTSLIIANKVLVGDFEPGFQTPVTAYGADVILEARGVELMI